MKMTRMISVCVAMLLLMCSVLTPAAFADDATPTELDELKPASYTIGEVTFSNGMLKGQAIHVDGTEAVKYVYVRITYFAENGTTVIVETFVHADGTFTSYASGSIEAISIVLTDVSGTPTMMPGTFANFAAKGLIV